MTYQSYITVSEYLVEVIKSLNIFEVFGVPGDFSFNICDAISHDNELNWIGCANELNASYAADGYARIHGKAVLSTTYGPGELSALCGIAGSYSANLPVIFVVGMPSTQIMRTKSLLHHTIGTGEFTPFYEMVKPITAAATILSTDNAVDEILRVVSTAIKESKPVYIGIPEDVARMPLPSSTILPEFRPTLQSSDPSKTILLAKQIAEKIEKSKNPIVLVGEHLRVYHAKEQALQLIEDKNLPFATMYADKSLFNENHPNFIGLYDGKVVNDAVRNFVESSDCVIVLGALMTDFNTGGFSTDLPAKSTITLMGDYIEINGYRYEEGFTLSDLINGIHRVLGAKELKKFKKHIGLSEVSYKGEDKITSNTMYPRWQKFFRPNDIIIAETGVITMGLSMTQLPHGAQYHNQSLWGSIGWATPAAFGAAIAARDKRVLLFTGEGSHQLTVQELGSFARFGVKPIIFVLNNNGYLIERLLCKESDIEYNDLAQWEYTKLPEAFGIKNWYVDRVTTNAEFDRALEKASKATTGVYIEVVTDTMDAPKFAIELAAKINVNRDYPVHLKDELENN